MNFKREKTSLKVAAILGQPSTEGQPTALNNTSGARVRAVKSRSFIKEADS
jgi:hypothetical protein